MVRKCQFKDLASVGSLYSQCACTLRHDSVHMCHDSIHMYHDSFICTMTLSYVPWLFHILVGSLYLQCACTSRHDSVNMCHDSFTCTMTHALNCSPSGVFIRNVPIHWDVTEFVCAMTHSHLPWLGSYVPWLIHMYHDSVRMSHDSFTFAMTWSMYATPHSWPPSGVFVYNVHTLRHDSFHMCHDSLIYTMTHSYTRPPSGFFIYNVPVCHDPFMSSHMIRFCVSQAWFLRMTCPIHICKTTPSYLWHDPFINEK